MIRCLSVFILPLAMLGLPAVDRATAQGPKPVSLDWPLFGGTPSRNMVNLTDKNVPVSWSVEKGKEKNVKWQAALGNDAYGGLVVSGGRVFVATNNFTPRDPKKKGNRSVLMCFDEKTGTFLWQALHDAPQGQIYNEVQKLGLLSTPCVDGDRVYYVLPQCQVVCADVKDGTTIWKYDMTKELKVLPFHCSNCSPLVAGDYVYLVTGNGIDEMTEKVHDAKAPSFIALDKMNGNLKWKSDLPGDRVIEGQWSNPAYGIVNGKPQVVFPGGDTALYSFEPITGNLIWEFHCYPKRPAGAERKFDNYIVSTPVIHDNKVYIGLGTYPGHPQRPKHSYFLCIDATKTGDVSPGGFGPDAVQPKNSALVWSYGGPIVPAPKNDRKVAFCSTVSTCAIHDGLIYIPEETGYLHCLEAAKGKKLWEYDFRTSVTSSPYYVDGKVYVGTEDGDMVIFEAGKECKVYDQKKMQFVKTERCENNIEMGETLSTPAVVNGVLFIATKSKVFAISAK
jgi:outer membrane protein assembly factor BamB